jgi:hypothetical protein
MRRADATGRLRDVCAGHGRDRSASGEMTLESEASAGLSTGARVDARPVLRAVSDRPRSVHTASASLSSFAHRVTRKSADRSLPARRKRMSGNGRRCTLNVRSGLQ